MPQRNRRRHRKGDFTCRCGVYHFPHRMLGGKCSAARWVRRHWRDNPHGVVCAECQCYSQFECQVDTGVEAAQHAECLMQFVHMEEIRAPWHKPKRK